MEFQERLRGSSPGISGVPGDSTGSQGVAEGIRGASRGIRAFQGSQWRFRWSHERWRLGELQGVSETFGGS